MSDIHRNTITTYNMSVKIIKYGRSNIFFLREIFRDN